MRTNQATEVVIVRLPQFACMEPGLHLTQAMLIQGLEAKEAIVLLR
jgi:hypothetical protein